MTAPLPFVVMPDTLVVARDYLLTVTPVTAIVGEAISTRIDSDPPDEYVRLRRNGGGEVVEFVIDRAVIDVHNYAQDEATASLLARTVQAAFLAARGYVHRLAVITNVEELIGPSWLPDPDRKPETPRYVASVAVSVRPNT